MARLFIFRWAPGDGPQERRCRALWRRIEPDRDWVTFIDRRGVLAFFALAPGDTSPILLEREQGGVFGPLFARDDPGEGPLQRLDQVSTEDLIEGAGEILTRKYWGPYAAVLHDRARDLLRVVREPCGGGAIFFAPLFKPSQGAQAIFTHASDFLALADKSEPDLDFLSAFMAAPRLVTSRTAIADVTEVLAGQEWSFPRDMKAIEGRSVWAPTPNAAL